MLESQPGPFKSFSVLWIPFSVPACLLGMIAWFIFVLSNTGLTAVFDNVSDTAAALQHFSQNLVSGVFAFRLTPGSSPWLFLSQCVIALLLWAVFGVAMSRCFAVRLARDEYIGLKEALGFGWRHAPSALLYPVIVGATIALLALFQALFGLAIQIPWLGIAFQLLLPLSFLASALMLVIGWTGFFGMGLVSGAIAVEQRGTLDAWGKALNYIFVRPIHFLLYLVIIQVVIVQILGRYLLEAQLLHQWTESSLTLFWHRDGFGSAFGGGDLNGADQVGGWIRNVFGRALSLTLWGLVISLAHAAFTGVFLILRRDVDGIDTSDIELAERPVDPMPIPVPTEPEGVSCAPELPSEEPPEAS